MNEYEPKDSTTRKIRRTINKTRYHIEMDSDGGSIVVPDNEISLIPTGLEPYVTPIDDRPHDDELALAQNMDIGPEEFSDDH